MRFTGHTIEISTYDRRLMRQSYEIEPQPHDRLLEICIMADRAFQEEFNDEFDLFDSLREQSGDMKDTFCVVGFANTNTMRLGRMITSLTGVARGRQSKINLYDLEV